MNYLLGTGILPDGEETMESKQWKAMSFFLPASLSPSVSELFHQYPEITFCLTSATKSDFTGFSESNAAANAGN